MTNNTTFINEPLDLGTYSIVLKDSFQFYTEGWIEPFDVNQMGTIVPFNFFENDDDAYEVIVYLTIDTEVDPKVTLSSKDNLGTGGSPSVILYSGTNVDTDPSSIAIEVDKLELENLIYLDSFKMSIALINVEGLKLTLAYANILNNKKSYAPVRT